MTATHLQTLSALARVNERLGYGPTVREVAAERGLGVSTAHAHLSSLRAEGLVDWADNRPRSMRLTAAGRERIA